MLIHETSAVTFRSQSVWQTTCQKVTVHYISSNISAAVREQTACHRLLFDISAPEFQPQPVNDYKLCCCLCLSTLVSTFLAFKPDSLTKYPVFPFLLMIQLLRWKLPCMNQWHISSNTKHFNTKRRMVLYEQNSE